MDYDVQVGDIIVAEQADSYLESSKAVDNLTSKNFELRLSGDPYKSDLDLVTHTQNLEYAYQDSAMKWVNQCTQRLEKLTNEAKCNELYNSGLLKKNPKMHTGNIASGPIVGGTTYFVEWLKKRDRKYLALEMEAAGIMTAARTRATSTLIIRGISDYCDDRKKELDKIGNGVLRRYAMSNAIALLWILIELSLLKRY